MAVKRGIAVWISGFLTFLAALSSFGMVIYWIREGRDFVLRPYLIGDIMSSLAGDLSVENHLWIFLTATFILLGITCVIAYRKQPPHPEIVKMFVKVGGNLAALRKTQEATATELAENIEYNRKTNRDLFKKANANIGAAKKETMAELENQGRAVKKVRRNMVDVEKKVDETREKMLGALKHQKTRIQEVGRLAKLSADAVKKQRAELEDMRSNLVRIVEELNPPQPKLKSQDDPEEIRGIGPRLGEELRALGIMNTGDLITADPNLIDEKTRASREMAERLQATAQLLMVPGVDENDAELLVDSGITSRRILADQELVPLSREIAELAKTYVEDGKLSEDERPTIEEVSSWIRIARS